MWHDVGDVRPFSKLRLKQGPSCQAERLVPRLLGVTSTHARSCRSVASVSSHEANCCYASAARSRSDRPCYCKCGGWDCKHGRLGQVANAIAVCKLTGNRRTTQLLTSLQMLLDFISLRHSMAMPPALKFSWLGESSLNASINEM